MNAMQPLATDPFWLEARGWCERNLETVTEKDVASLAASLRLQQFQRSIKPWLDIKMHVYSRTMPLITMDLEGANIRSELVFSDEDQKIIDECDKWIADMAERYRAPNNDGGSAAGDLCNKP